MTERSDAIGILPGTAAGPITVLQEPLSFWGGVDPETGNIIDVHHPQHGVALQGAIVMMPSSRGSCSGSGVLLQLALAGRAPAALVFTDPEDVLTLGALVATEMFQRSIPVVRLSPEMFLALASVRHARITLTAIEAEGLHIPIVSPAALPLALDANDEGMLAGRDGEAVRQAMRIICAMARQQGATALVDVTRGHIDGCIYASPANLTFAQRMEGLGARVRIPTTMNAISVDLVNWRAQGVAPDFGAPAAQLAESYVRMGCQPTFTCSPYLLEAPPATGEAIAWSESNAVIFANSVLGARTAKHPDFLDLCIALTGRAPLSGVYFDEHRKARRIIDIDLPEDAAGAIWPLLGYLAGQAAPDRIPLLRGLSRGRPSRDDLKALCAAFGTTSAAPMLHIEGVTPEAAMAVSDGADHVVITRAEMAAVFERLNEGPEAVQLVAIGSPHASLSECRALADALAGRPRHLDVSVIVTAGRQVIGAAQADGTLARLRASQVEVFADLCWCSISRPVFPESARTVLTNSGKYAHYGPGLSGCAVRFGTMDDCVEAAVTGRVPPRLPDWLR